MGTRKSSEFKVLLMHLGIQFSVMTIGLIFAYNPFTVFYFALLNTLIHGVIDWNIWKLYKVSAHLRIKKQCLPGDRVYYDKLVREWKYWEDSVFYDTIGFDQLLHGLTLILLAGWLM
jgi:hypothetical protein